MFFEELKINEILNCNKCQEKLDDPKILPCGDYICSRCVSSIYVNNNKFQCIVCNELHIMPEKGLPTSKKLLTLISMHPAEVYRSKTVEQLKESLKEMREKSKCLSFSALNGIDFIKEYCLNLINDVQIDTEKLIKQINDYEISCFESYAKVKQDTKDKFVNTANELDRFESKWIEYLKQIKIDDDAISNAYNEALNLNERASEEQLSLENLILNEKGLKFELNVAKPVESIIGSLEGKAIDSKILSTSQCFQLMNLCSFSKQWKLIYRASKDGFGANDFHLNCDKKQNTLVVIKSTSGNIFGGYTEQDWTNTDGYRNDPKAFIFSLVNKENKPIALKPQNQNVIVCNSNYGPIFGDGHCVCISNHSNQNNESSSNLGSCFKHPTHAFGSNEAKSFLAGSNYFKTIEIEVYTNK